MPAPKSTASYPIWLKQTLQVIVDKPEILPKVFTFADTTELMQFRRVFYGYLKALQREEEAIAKTRPDYSPQYPLYNQIMTRKPIASEKLGRDPELTLVLDWRDNDPRTLSIRDQFQDVINQGLASTSHQGVQASSTGMDDALSDYYSSEN